MRKKALQKKSVASAVGAITTSYALNDLAQRSSKASDDGGAPGW